MAEKSLVDYFVSAGYSRQNAVRALEKTRNEPERALEILESEREKDLSSFQEPQPVTDNRGSGVKNEYSDYDQDQELKEALRMSLNQHTETEDEDLKRALELSKQPTHDPFDPTNQISSQEDRDMNQAIEQSLQTANSENVLSYLSDKEPRDPSLGVGLKNVGNTCYINSLLQTYFYLPHFREVVLSFPVKDITSTNPQTDSHHVSFMRELKRLFAFMLLSKRKFIDPLPLLKTMRDKSGNYIRLGSQEDVSEVNELFLQHIEDALKFEFNSSQQITNFFYGESIEYLTWKTQKSQEIENKALFSHLIVPVSTEFKDLQSTFENSLTSQVEYKLEDGNIINANKSFWVLQFPQVLTFLQNRVHYDSKTQLYEKQNCKLMFPKVIHMDRYLLKNKNQTLNSRNKLAHLRTSLVEVQKKVAEIQDTMGPGHGLLEAIKTTASYLSQVDDETNNMSHPNITSSDCLELLNYHYNKQNEILISAKKQKSELEQLIDSEYSALSFETNQGEEYHLFAVWIHSGVAHSGHYWAYIVPPKQPTLPATSTIESQNKWMRFNDIHVSWVDEEVVLREAFGGEQSGTSAYYLIYLKSDHFKTYTAQLSEQQQQQQHQHHISLFRNSPQLKIEIQLDNAEFINESQIDLQTHSLVNSIVEQFNVKGMEEIRLSASQYRDFDYRLTRFESFLNSIKAICYQIYILGQLLHNLYPDFTQLSDDFVGLLVKKLSSSVVRPVLLGSMNEDIQRLKIEHETFICVSLFIDCCLETFQKLRYSESVQYLYWAGVYDSRLNYDSLKKKSIITSIANKIVEFEFQEALNNLEGRYIKLKRLGLLMSLSNFQIHKIHSYYETLREFYSRYPENSQTSEILQLFRYVDQEGLFPSREMGSTSSSTSTSFNLSKLEQQQELENLCQIPKKFDKKPEMVANDLKKKLAWFQNSFIHNK